MDNLPDLGPYYEGEADIFVLLSRLPKKASGLLCSIIKAIAVKKLNIKKNYQIEKYWLFENFGLDEYTTSNKVLRDHYEEGAKYLKNIRITLTSKDQNGTIEKSEDLILLEHSWRPSKDYFEVKMNPSVVRMLLEFLDETFSGIVINVSEKKTN